MRKSFFAIASALILSGAPAVFGAPDNSIVSTVYSEATILLGSSTSQKSKLPNTKLSIPWDKPSFQFWLSYYKNNWNRMKLFSLLDNFKVFYPTVKRIFKEEGIPEDLVFLAVVESNGNPSAVSKAGAAGLWQLMPATAKLYGLKVNRYIDERFDIEKSTHAAAKYLKYLHSLFGRWDLAIAAYNAGPGTIFKRLKLVGAEHFWDLTKLPDETLNYVPKFYAILSIIKEKSFFENKKNSATLLKIKVLSKTSLYRISKKLKVPYYITKRFNSQYRRRVVPAGHYVYIPSKFVKRTNLLKYISSSKIYVYIPKKREKIVSIARRFGADAKLIKEINRLKRTVVYRGQTILIVKTDYKKEAVENGNS
ncbi:transglycosylase SLT domain-containing protein [Desulfurobacterium thermolithotrophum]|uniref:lytic transglycosylase domain-containing protein n=1 Tax=Desulfurobacterium thermolithotrophum TaxID=64160 RepID=UPI0013CF8CC0|nr:lytic transglycosylase domain-containing protein [Desulfurobacterium thermolithotrophum]